MRGIRVWARLLGLRGAVVEDVEFGSEGEVIVIGPAGLARAGSLRDLPAPIARV